MHRDNKIIITTEAFYWMLNKPYEFELSVDASKAGALTGFLNSEGIPHTQECEFGTMYFRFQDEATCERVGEIILKMQ